MGQMSLLNILSLNFFSPPLFYFELVVQVEAMLEICRLYENVVVFFIGVVVAGHVSAAAAAASLLVCACARFLLPTAACLPVQQQVLTLFEHRQQSACVYV